MIAEKKLSPQAAKGISLFTEVQQKLNLPGARAEDVLRDEDIKESLRQTMVATPTSLSARLLLRVTTGQFDKLSIDGTLYAIETMAPTIFTAVRSSVPNDLRKIPNAVAQEEVARLVAAKGQFDPRALSLLDAVINYGEAVRTYTERPADTPVENAARNRTLQLTAREVVGVLTKFKTTPHR